LFEALIVTLREGVEGALVLAVALVVLERQGRSRLRGPLLAGAACALAASVLVAAWLTRIAFNEELAEGIAMLVGAALVVSLVVWMWRASSRLKEEVERGVERAAASGHSAWAVFLFAFLMVIREGAETAVFLSAASFTTAGLELWVGAAIGLALAVLFGVLFVRGSLRVPLRPFFTFTTAVLILIALQLVVGGLHELSEAEVLPASQREMALIGPLVRNELLIFALTVALAAVWLLRPAAPLAAAGQAAAAPAGRGPEARLQRASRLRELALRRWLGAVALLVVGFLATAFVQGSRMPERPVAQPLADEGGIYRVPAAPLADGRLHFFAATLPEGTVRFFAVLVGDRVRTCFDACEICGAKGYHEEGTTVVCRNCASPIPRATLGRSGGCNPIPLPHRVVGGIGGAVLEVSAADLRAALPLLEGR
jgi:FTR1 family protein